MKSNLQVSNNTKNTFYPSINRYSELYKYGDELTHMSIFIDNSPTMDQYRELIINIYNNEILKMIELGRIHGRSFARRRRNEEFISPVLCSCNLFKNQDNTKNQYIPFNKLPYLSKENYFLDREIDILGIIRNEVYRLKNTCFDVRSEGFLTLAGSIIFSNGNHSTKITKTIDDEIKTLLQEECFHNRLESPVRMNIVCTEEEGLLFFKRLGFVMDENLFLVSRNKKNNRLYSKISESFTFTDPEPYDSENDDYESRIVIL